MSYNTKQKEEILDIISKQRKEFTIKDIHDKLETVGLTTIYRLVDKLVEEGKINKRIGKDNITYYQYLEECEHTNHFYLRCDNCGDMKHIDCDCIEDLSNHIFKEHNFTSDKNIIINGLCNKCNK